MFFGYHQQVTQQDKTVVIEDTNYSITSFSASSFLGPDQTLCPGDMITLDPGTGGTGGTCTYLWAPGGETTQTITVSTPGTYSVCLDCVVFSPNGIVPQKSTVNAAASCSSGVADTIGIIAAVIPPVSFTAPPDLCDNAGIQTGLGGGTPTGGVYSSTSAGVVDDGNGLTYSFDPALAGVGTHTITYEFTTADLCVVTVSDPVEIFASTPSSFAVVLPDFCDNVGIQTSLGGGLPLGGVYSGSGVTDDGDGTTFSFDPGTAAIGSNTITYTFTNADACITTASNTIDVLPSPTVTFTPPSDLCIDAGVQSGLTGGAPAGGIYAGPGVTDNGNGTTFTFDPSAAGLGIHSIDYVFTATNGCSNFSTINLAVFNLPGLSFTTPANVCIDADVQNGLSGASPIGGIYSGTGVTDDGNGNTFSFDPAIAGVGSQNIIYTFTDANGCSNFILTSLQIFDLPSLSFSAPANVCIDAGVQNGLSGASPIGGIYSGTGVTDDGNGNTFSFDPAIAGVGSQNITYTFTDANGCSNFILTSLQIFDLPSLSFSAPANVCIDAGVQNGLSGASPIGGIYSGTGVTDDGNGNTFSFDPAIAGVGSTKHHLHFYRCQWMFQFHFNQSTSF